MEYLEYNSESNLHRQDTFETDPTFTNRSKSGSVRRGNLSLPIIGPRNFTRNRSAERSPTTTRQRLRREANDRLSPEDIGRKSAPINKSHTKVLLGNIREVSNEKTSAKVKDKSNLSADNKDIKNSTIVVKPRQKTGSEKQTTKRKDDSKSVDSGDSSKENIHTIQKKESPSKASILSKINNSQNVSNEKRSEAKPKVTAPSTRNDSADKNNKLIETNRKESAGSKNKSKDSIKNQSTDLKNKTIDTKKVDNTKTGEKNEKKSETKPQSKVISKSDNSIAQNRPQQDKDKFTNNSNNDVKSKVTKPVVKQPTPSQDYNTKGDNLQSNPEKLIPSKTVQRREKLRDKLTSTPISDFSGNNKPTKGTKSVVHVKEIQSENTKLKANITTTPHKVITKPKEASEKDVKPNVLGTNVQKEQQYALQNKKVSSITESVVSADKKDDVKKNKLKHVNTYREIVEKEPNRARQETHKYLQSKQPVSKVERKPSIESIESGFASSRKSKESISVLVEVETEVSKPPQNTQLDRPYSDKSYSSSRVASEKRKEAIDRNPYGQVIHELSGDYKPPKFMEPASQRRPGSERMTETYESIYEERRTLLQAEVTYKKRIKQLEEEMNQFLKTIDDLRSENKALRTKIDTLENSSGQGNGMDVEQFKLTIKDLETQNKAIGTKLDQTEAELEKLKPERNKLVAESDKITTKLVEVQSKYDSVSDELDKLKKGHENMTAKLEKEINKLQTDLRNEQTERQKLSDENTILKTDKDVLKDEIVALRSINKNLEAMNEELKNENPTELPSSEKMELKSQIIKLQTENQSLNEENIKLKAESLKQVKTIHDLEKTAKSFESSITAVESSKLTEIQDLKNENAKLLAEIKEMKETYSEADSKIKSLEAENKTLDESLNQKKGEITELLSAMKDDKISDEIQNLKIENKRLQTIVEEHNKKTEDSSKHLEEIKIEKDKFETEKNKLTQKINELLEINQVQKKQIAEVQTNLDSAKREVESNNEKLKHIEKYETELTEINTKLKQTEDERDKLIKQKQEEIEELKLKMDRSNADHKEKMDALKMDYEKEIDELKKQIEFLQKEIDALRELKAVESELLETKDELMTVKEKYSKMVAELEEKSEIEQKNFQLNVRINQMNNTIKQLERDQKDWLVKKQQYEEIEETNKKIQEENMSLKHRGGVRKVSKTIDKQLEVLERKQKDAETRVKQLEGWVGDLYDDDRDKATYVGSLSSLKPTPSKKKPFTKAPTKQPITTIRVENDRPRSLEHVIMKEKDMYSEKSERSDKLSHSSTPNLPAIHPDTRLTFGLGYSQIHRSRIKAAQKYRK